MKLKKYELSKEYDRLIPHNFHIWNINTFQIDSIDKLQGK